MAGRRCIRRPFLALDFGEACVGLYSSAFSHLDRADDSLERLEKVRRQRGG